MEINLEVVHSIIRLQLKNHENTLSTSGVLLILLKIALRKISKSPSNFQLENNGISEKQSLRSEYFTDFNNFFTVTCKHNDVVPVKILSTSKDFIKGKHGF